jgi:monoamine oxidase
MVAQQLGPVINEVGDPSAPGWPPASLLRYDQMSALDLLRQRGLSDDAIAAVLLGVADQELLQSLSALWLLQALANEQTEKIKYKIRGGNDLLPLAFAKRLAEHIHYGAPVVRIARDAEGVRVGYRQHGTEHTAAAAYLICTLPFPVLRRLEVVPPFSPQKQRAIKELHYDSVTRAFVQVKERYWEASGANGFGLTDDPTEMWHGTWDQPGRRSLLISYMHNGTARRVAAMGEDQRTQAVLDQINRVLPGLREHAEGVIMKIWDEDEWAGGAYALHKPGQMEALLSYAAQPEGRVYFAGEHVSSWPSWMQGALESGIRVAREINDAP